MNRKDYVLLSTSIRRILERETAQDTLNANAGVKTTYAAGVRLLAAGITADLAAENPNNFEILRFLRDAGMGVDADNQQKADEGKLRQAEFIGRTGSFFTFEFKDTHQVVHLLGNQMSPEVRDVVWNKNGAVPITSIGYLCMLEYRSNATSGGWYAS